MVLARLLAAALAVLLVIRLAGAERGTVLMLLIGALPLTLLLAYPLLAFAVLLRQVLLSVAALGLVGAHLLVVAPALGAEDLPPGAADTPRLRVVTANLYVLNPDPAAAGRALRAAEPDVLVVPELDGKGLAGLRASGLLEDLPHAVVQEESGGDETVGLFSRLPLKDVERRRIGGRTLPRATVSVDGVEIRLLAAHPLPPLSVYTEVWRRSLADLAAESREVELPTVVAGDLNADRDHAAFRDLLETGLRDAHDERGRGLTRTWPESLPILHLDHVLVRDGAGGQLVVLDVQELEVPGSDHLAVAADLAVLPR